MRHSVRVGAVIGLFCVAFILITAIRQRDEQVDGGASQAFSGARKAQIARFWDAYRRASDLRQSGNLEAAAGAYRAALQLDNRHEDTLYYLGNTLFDLGRYDDALLAFRQLIGVNPLSARAHFQAGAILSCPAAGAPFDLKSAEQEFRRTLEINREESEPLIRLGEVALAGNRLDEAERHLTDATRLNVKAPGACYLLGYIYWTRGDKRKASEWLETALRRSAVEKPAAGMSGEGDRRTPSSGDMRRQSLFAPFIETIATLPENSAARIEAVYAPLARFCASLAEQRNRPRGNAPKGEAGHGT